MKRTGPSIGVVMTKYETKKIGVVLAQADGGRSTCVQDLVEKFIESFPGACITSLKKGLLLGADFCEDEVNEWLQSISNEGER